MTPFCRGLAGACLLAPLLTGCADRSLAPEPVALDRAACARCGMLISRLDHAAQAVYADADPRFYDDVGCMATDPEAERGEHRLYVHTEDGEWTAAGSARFVLDNGVRTPMGYGVVALTGDEAAGRQAAILSWAELVDALERRQ